MLTSGTAASAATCTFESIDFRGIKGNLVRGITLGGQNSGAPMGAISRVNVEGDFALSSPNYQMEAITLLQYFASHVSVRVAGSIDASQMQNTFDPFMIGRTDTGAISAGVHGDIDLSQLRLRAYRTGVNIASSSGTGPGYYNFCGAVIEYNTMNAVTGSFGIAMQLTAAPGKVSWFNGGVIRNVGPGGIGTGNTPAINFIGGVRNDDISGVTVNDVVTATAGANTYQSTNVRLEGVAEFVWRSSSPSVYLDGKGRLTADTVPTYGSAQAGTTVYNRTAGAGIPVGWTYDTAWRAMPNKS